ncbi:trypsin-like peptidase domain-containing protein [Candidatus Protochlamydia amoebophila]|uniref:trypsin-like peptidase domain-containing protein n=1 Tax=Candidatus Protochlamydia amoebophila TaxID=362787 RepID=UPI001BC9998C|nr:trypsin-like peptidase domain-containing protein [Candidatus Protochlamydia amoebophila]
MWPISSGLQPYSISYSNNNDFSRKEMPFVEYKSMQDVTRRAFIDDLNCATYPIHGSCGSFQGNCFAIAPDLLLTCRHCLEEGEIRGPFGTRKVIFDGVMYCGLDFAVLWVEGGRFNPVTLDSDSDVEESIQMYHKPKGLTLNKYVKPFTSESKLYAKRGNFAFSQTDPGESGAPRMSLRNGYVHTMHQGNGEGLTMNAFYAILMQAQNEGSGNANYILSNIKVEHLATRIVNWSSLIIRSEDVAEKPRINEDVRICDPKNPQKVLATFHFREVGERKGNRWITIYKKGIENSEITYGISPNPHVNKTYKNDGEKEFYRTLAVSIGTYYLSNKTYPIEGTIKVYNQNFILTKYSIDFSI